MANLQKLDDSINELESIKDELKEFSEIYSKLSSLKEDIENNRKSIHDTFDQFRILNDKISLSEKSFGGLVSRFNDSAGLLEKKLTSFESDLKEITGKELENFIDLTSELNKELKESLHNNLLDIGSAVSEGHKDIQAMISNLNSELRQNLNIKLEENKSDIKVEIRNEGAQIQRGIENAINQSSLNFSKESGERFDKLNKRINYILFSALIIIVMLAAVISWVHK